MRRWSMVLAVALGLLPLARQVSAAEPERATVNGVTLERLEGTEPNWRVIGVDRMRKFDVLDLTQEALGGRQVVELPAGDFKVSFYDPDKREEVEDDLKLFEGVSVKTIRLPGTIETLDTTCLRGVEGLETLVFAGRVPRFQEKDRRIWGGINRSWMGDLKQVVFEDEVAPERLGGIFDAIETIAFGAKAKIPTRKEQAEALLREASSLKRLVVPFSLAIQEKIPWWSIVQHSPLAKEEVISAPSTDEPRKFRTFKAFYAERGLPYEEAESAVCLLNCGEEAEISDKVTDIRLDALGAIGRDTRIYLPTFFRRFLTPPSDTWENRFWLKQDTVRFFPDISEPRNQQARKGDRIFPDVFAAAPLSISSPYHGLFVEAEVTEGVHNGWCARPQGWEPGAPTEAWQDAHGLVYGQTLRLAMDHRYRLRPQLLLANGKRLPVMIDTGRTNTTIAFSTPPQRHWLLGATLWLLGVLVAYVALLWGCARFLKGGWLDRNLAQPFLEAEWWQHALFAGSVALIVLSAYEVPKSLAQVWLWAEVANYLNGSFLSSLLISISTTLVQIALGLLKGVSFSIYVVQVELEPIIAPCTDVLARVGWFSWLSTVCLAFLRILSEILRECATEIWVTLGCLTLFHTWPTRFMAGLRERCAWLGGVLSVAGFLAIGLPLFLFCCSWFSLRMMAHAGNTFNDALASFASLADSFSIQTFISLTALKECMGLLMDALAELTSASVFYIVTKCFDCFLVPLGLLWMTLTALRRFGMVKGVSFRDFASYGSFRERFLPDRPVVSIKRPQAATGDLEAAKTDKTLDAPAAKARDRQA